jgi:hypothetical protein
MRRKKLLIAEVLSEKVVVNRIKNISYRKRIFSPLITIFIFLGCYI